MSHDDKCFWFATVMTLLVLAGWLCGWIISGNIAMQQDQHRFWSHWRTTTVTITDKPTLSSGLFWYPVSYTNWDGNSDTSTILEQQGLDVGQKVDGVWLNDHNQLNGVWQQDYSNKPQEPGMAGLNMGMAILGTLVLIFVVPFASYRWADSRPRRKQKRADKQSHKFERKRQRKLLEAEAKARYDAIYNAALKELEQL